MARKSEVEALAKVLHRASERKYSLQAGVKPYLWCYENDGCKDRFRAMARAAIAHLKPKRGAKRVRAK